MVKINNNRNIILKADLLRKDIYGTKAFVSAKHQTARTRRRLIEKQYKVNQFIKKIQRIEGDLP